jgi:predicted phage-related endonuclease
MTGVEIIRPKDRTAWLRARGRDITASVVGALFGEHEFLTEFELWATKTGRVPNTVDETPAMARGRLLEPVAIQLLREQYPDWKIEHNAAENIYFRDPLARLGATPDAIVHAPGRGKGVVQIKSVEANVYRRKWLDADGAPEVPFWIALQAALEAHLTGSQWAAVAPLVVGHGLEMPLIEIPLVDGVVDAMKARAAEFWAMVEEGREPQPDYGRDGALIDRLYAHGDEFEEIDLTADNRIPDLLAQRAAFAKEQRVNRDAIERIDAEVKLKLGNAHVAHLAGGRKITWKLQRRAGSFVPPSETRVLRYPPAEREN